jgi:hypothetical protein
MLSSGAGLLVDTASIAARAFAPSERLSTLRRVLCVSPSLNSLVPREQIGQTVGSDPFAAENVSSLGSTARTSSKRPTA